MKFAKELEDELVPEWKSLYFDYKGGKKKIRELSYVIRKASASQRALAPVAEGEFISENAQVEASRSHSREQGSSKYQDGNDLAVPERYSLRLSPVWSRNNYGSIPPALDLPGPALNPVQKSVSASAAPNAFEVGKTTSPQSKNFPFVRRNFSRGKTMNVIPRVDQSPRNALQRLASGVWVRASPRTDAELQAIDPITARRRKFFGWLDSELNKIETFYKAMEDKNDERLKVLREQLHQFHARRMQELADAQRQDARDENDKNKPHYVHGNSHFAISTDRVSEWFGPLGKAIAPQTGRNTRALQKLSMSPGKEELPNSKEHHPGYMESGRDYVQRHSTEADGPDYRSAKHKLKLALQEFYRGLELLKSYARLNRTAFRKINKKYDKAVHSKKPMQYMSEKVNNAYFVQSEKLESHISEIEDLYSRYFQGGNRKIAVGKLRTQAARRPDYYLFGISNGLMIGIAAVFTVQGLIFAVSQSRHKPGPFIHDEIRYLLQLYGGYFLCLYLFYWFCFDCMVWTKNKINYQFVFEFDSRHKLDWQELLNFPAFFSLLLGLLMWLNFSGYGSQTMFLWYPLVLICLTVAIIFFPYQILFYRSRRWFIYSNWRLLCAGAYQVEFRDFFLGDMYGSLSYAMANIELFFCLYIPKDHWLSPGQCNSSSSSYKGRLLGFCSALPAIWRALQCIRRYADSGDKYPHLANCGKYLMTIAYYTTLSLFRIHNHPATKASFIVFAALNGVYVTFWDLVNDWSLCQPYATARFLRDVRGFKQSWWYYVAMIIDPMLRFSWIFYAIYTHDAGHASLVSFMIAFTEVTRRGMWTLFRVENEHSTNVGHFRAFRDVPLPYKLDGASFETSDPPTREAAAVQAAEAAEGDQLGTVPPKSPDMMAARRRSTLSRTFSRTVSRSDPPAGSDKPPSQQGGAGPHRLKRAGSLAQMFAEGHAKDFVKKKPAQGSVDLEANYGGRGNEDSDDGDSPNETHAA